MLSFTTIMSHWGWLIFPLDFSAAGSILTRDVIPFFTKLKVPSNRLEISLEISIKIGLTAPY